MIERTGKVSLTRLCRFSLMILEAGAKITAVTVTEPYPLAAVTASQPDAPLEDKKLAEGAITEFW